MAGELVNDQAPLAGVVMCCTSIPPDERHELALSATQMGADHKYDLTSDVTHLIVGNVDTAKYRYVAKERPDVKVVLPQFIKAVRESWMQGGDTDVEALEREHRTPTLHELRICVTGFENLIKRQEITSLVQQHGAEYHGDLTKDVTHLIAFAPQGKKYEHAIRWDIKVVGQEWLTDSIERGMVLDEKLYDPNLAPQDRGKNSWNRKAIESMTLGKRLRLDETPTEAASNRRKLRRTMSAKYTSQKEMIWADIASASAGSGKLKQEEWQPVEQGRMLAVGPNQAVSAEATPDPTIEPVQRKSTLADSNDSLNATTQGKGIFGGALVYVRGFPNAKTDILRTHLESHGAQVVTVPEALDKDNEWNDGFLIIPHDLPNDQIPPIPEAASRFLRVTEWWVERCLSTKKIVSPEEYPLCKPFAKLSIDGFENMTICSTGFKSVDLLHLTKTARLMGATYDEYLKPSISVLVCNSASVNKEKLDFAAENNIPVVTEKWLWACIEAGAVQNFEEYSVQTETPTLPVNYRPQIRGPKEMRRLQGPAKSRRPLQLDSKAPSLDRRKSTSNKAGKMQDNAKHGPFIEEDLDDHAPGVVGGEGGEEEAPLQPSQPLRELSQEQVNSSKRPSQILARQSDDHPAKAKDSSHPEPARSIGTAKPSGSAASDTSHLNDTIAALLAQKQASTRQASDPPESNLSRRKRGLLGRATSGSYSSNADLQDSISHPLTRADSNNMSLDQIAMMTSQERAMSEGINDKVPDAMLVPSQKIIYEDEKAREERAKLIMRLGGKPVDVDAERVIVQSIGVVKDAVSEGVLGSRVRRRGGRNVG